MNRVYKAYKCVFPNLFIDLYDMNMWEDPNQFEVIYGKNQKEAVKDRCSNDDVLTFLEVKEHIKTRRYPEGDLYKHKKSKLLNDLSEKQLHHLTHSLGVKEGDIFTSDFYRNYSYYSEPNKDCEKLLELGLMRVNNDELGNVYHVTDIGIEAVKTLLLTTKNLSPHGEGMRLTN